MTIETIIDTMKNLKIQWGILKDDKNAKVDRRTACKRIIELSSVAKTLDPKFEVIDMSNTQYAEFVPTTHKLESNVNWEKRLEPKKEILNARLLIEELESEAVDMTRTRLPKEPEDSQKFGMITSAYTDKLLKAYIFQHS